MQSTDEQAPRGIIDCDGHVIEPEEAWQRWLPSGFHERRPMRVVDELGYERVSFEGKLHRRGSHPKGAGPRAKHLMAGARDPVARLADLDAEGIARTILFPTIALICYPSLRDAAFAASFCRAYNNWISEFCAAAPDRLLSVAIVPLHFDVSEAIVELERVREMGFVGVAIRPNNVGGKSLHDSAFDRFWACAAELHAPIFLHEGASALTSAGGADRFDRYASRHVLCHPLEQMSAMTSFIMEGILARHPGLRVLFMEAGAGWVPYLLERMDEHFSVMRGQYSHLDRPPSDYFRSQAMVSPEGAECGLRVAIDYLGIERLVFASDYPHFNGVFPGAADPILEHPALSAREKQALLQDNGLALLAYAGV